MASRDLGNEASRDDLQGIDDVTDHVRQLQRQEQTLQQEISQLQEQYDQRLKQQAKESQVVLSRLVDETLSELSQQRQALQLEVEQLERRRDRIQEEMRSSFAGVSQDLAVRVQGFKDYLVGSLQDLATAAEQLPVTVPNSPPSVSPVPIDLQVPLKEPGLKVPEWQTTASRRQSFAPQASPSDRSSDGSRLRDLPPSPRSSSHQDDSSGSSHGFERDAKHIRQILDQYRRSPNYYGTSWQLRRTFEPIHAKRVSRWFFDFGGRGSLKSMGSRLQNILVASAIISVLRMMRGDRVRVLILSDSPERLGEWRRGFQDSLGLSRSDFGAQQGIALFEAPEAVCQRADRLMEQGNQPLILIDNAEDKVHLSLLQYSLWLAFASDPREIPMY